MGATVGIVGMMAGTRMSDLTGPDPVPGPDRLDGARGAFAAGGGSSSTSVAAEGWVSTTQGAHLRGRRTRDTTPELALRRAVHAQGGRFRLNRRVCGSRPDFVLPGRRTAVFVDGCFWHDCPLHGPRQLCGPNAARWRAKLDDNKARDRRYDRLLAQEGWVVVRVWECEVRQDVVAAAARILGVRGPGTAGAAASQ